MSDLIEGLLCVGALAVIMIVGVVATVLLFMLAHGGIIILGWALIEAAKIISGAT